MQITELFESHNKTVTRQSSSQRESRRLSKKLHYLNFVFPPKMKPLAQSTSVARRRRRPFRCRCLIVRQGTQAENKIYNVDLLNLKTWQVIYIEKSNDGKKDSSNSRHLQESWYTYLKDAEQLLLEQ